MATMRRRYDRRRGDEASLSWRVLRRRVARLIRGISATSPLRPPLQSRASRMRRRSPASPLTVRFASTGPSPLSSSDTAIEDLRRRRRDPQP
ncbi:MAG: hypothetical protein CSA66_04310 [Proteobacteria bacterium]|nr:MAG: hypothetical protein CSA66_04310 [Pseudomonadota bacterium]